MSGWSFSNPFGSSSSSSSSSSAAPAAAGSGSTTYGTVAGVGHEAGAKDVVWKIFGKDLGEKLALAAGHGKQKDYRGVLEPTGAVTQCERTGHPFKPEMDCYLCGLPIPAKEALRGPEDELYVECEHILPVTEARWFLDLYMTNRLPTDQWTKTALELEYDQAHRVCNQAKSNFSFIRADTNTGLPGISSVGIKKILKNIQSRARQHVSDYTGELRQRMIDIADTIQSREKAIRERVEKILAHIQSQPATQDRANEAMILLTRTALLADPNTLPSSVRKIHDEWYANTGAAQAERQRLFDAFVTETLAANPSLDPNVGLLASIDQTIVPSNVVTREFVLSILQTFFVKYAVQVTTPDPSGAFLANTVFYGIYLEALRKKLSGPYKAEDYPTICKLYDAAATYATQEPRVATILSPLPTLANDVRTKCEIDKKNAERAERAKRREAQPTPEDVATRELGDLKSYLKTVLLANYKRLGDRGAERQAELLYGTAHQAFVLAYPEGIDRAKEAAAEAVTGPIDLIGLSVPPSPAPQPRLGPRGIREAEYVTALNPASILARMGAEQPTLSERVFAYVLGQREVFMDDANKRTRDARVKSAGPYGGATYRKSKRAKSSLRTRRARHSGPSKLLKKRSSRKSRTGK